jgi:hypothetical protein
MFVNISLKMIRNKLEELKMIRNKNEPPTSFIWSLSYLIHKTYYYPKPDIYILINKIRRAKHILVPFGQSL